MWENLPEDALTVRVGINTAKNLFRPCFGTPHLEGMSNISPHCHSRHEALLISIHPSTHPCWNLNQSTCAKFRKKSWSWERSIPGRGGSCPCMVTWFLYACVIEKCKMYRKLQYVHDECLFHHLVHCHLLASLCRYKEISNSTWPPRQARRGWESQNRKIKNLASSKDDVV